MKIANGWDVYMKMKELSGGNGKAGRQEVHIDDLARACGIKKEVAQEYVKALAVLKFIEFTDGSKEVFLMTDLAGTE